VKEILREGGGVGKKYRREKVGREGERERERGREREIFYCKN